MKTLKEDWILVCELFKAWAEEVSEPIKGIYINDFSYIGWAELESGTIFYRDIQILNDILETHDLQIYTISMNNDSLEIWFMRRQQ